MLGTGHAPIEFEAHEGLCGAGVLFLLPALLAQGLLKTKEVYTLPQSHYYGLESIILTLAFMALGRIKNPEQLKQCKPGDRYNKLKQESKMLMNIIKMICYRAETAVANELMVKLVNAKDQKRMLVKQIIQNNADLIPDYDKKTLTVILHTLSAPRFNDEAAKLAKILNQTETIFPGSDLKLKFEISANSNCEK